MPSHVGHSTVRVLLSFLQGLREAVVVMDRETRIVYANPAYSEVLGVPLQKVLGRKVAEIEPEAGALQVFRTRQPLTNQFEVVKSVGKPIYFHATPIFRGRPLVAVACLFRSAEGVAPTPTPNSQFSSTLPPSLAALAGKNKKFLEVLDLAARVAPSDATVLLQGESGTGKELLAKAIHAASDRANGPFVPVNCPGIPESLFESELFGYAGGAFTGARACGKKGRFELAQGGTLFLDEVADLPLEVQAKLLRALQEREIDRVGGQRTVAVDARIIAATNRPLQELVRAGRFRADLYFRLNVIPLCLPPLRERLEDLPVLVQTILRKYAPQKYVAEEVWSLLQQHPWEGNIRELENVLCYAAVTSRGNTVTAADLPPYLKASASNLPRYDRAGPDSQTPRLRDSLAHAEREILLEALRRCHNNRSAAMRLLGISRKTFYRKLRQHDLLVAPALRQ